MNRGQDAYDDFYAGIYDLIYKTEERSKYEAQQIVLATQPDTEFSRFLDIGCGKGYQLFELTQLCPGVEVYGVDISKYEIDKIDIARMQRLIKNRQSFRIEA
jgi:SAM-dependent methyltransferase